ncbi:MAG: hypothetical protein AAGJ46_07770 [Planctomycetota bacterium]
MPTGATLAVFDPLNSHPPTTGNARLDLRAGWPVLDFADTTSEATDFIGIVPSIYSGLGLDLRLSFTATSATTGAVVWAAKLERVQHGVADIDGEAFGAEHATTTNVAATSGAIASASISVPAADLSGLMAGDVYRLRVRRVAADAADTATGDAELVALEVREV